MWFYFAPSRSAIPPNDFLARNVLSQEESFSFGHLFSPYCFIMNICSSSDTYARSLGFIISTLVDSDHDADDIITRRYCVGLSHISLVRQYVGSPRIKAALRRVLSCLNALQFSNVVTASAMKYE